MPQALLLSPDDQAVTAITDVLQELAVNCERPLDGVSAAQKLNSQSFDLVLVDCENLPAAKLIFDVCRRGKNGVNPVPIAIVDGRAGLPTAFRLGAELILTKPVSKDQARSTIRAAVTRVRKTVHTGEAASAPPASVDSNSNDLPATSSAGDPEIAMTSAKPEVRARAAAAGAGSAHSASMAESGTAAPANSQSAVDEIDAPSNPVYLKSTRPQIPSDDPVLAELEKTELEQSEIPESPGKSALKESQKASGAAHVQADPPVSKSDVPVSQVGANNARRRLVAVLMLAVACGGFYAAWTFQPGFQAVVQPQIDRVLGLVGMAPAAKPPAKPVTQPANATAPVVKTELSPPQSATPVSANSATLPVAASNASGSSAPPSATAPLATKPSSASPATAATIKPAEGKTAAIAPTETKSDAALTNAPQSDEKSAIVLSSKGAENRLSYSPPPKSPAGVRTGSAEGTVVLKAVVDDKGKVEGLRLVEGNTALATAAIEAVKQWRYRPYIRDGKAQPFETVVIVDFSH
jgi:periplasmic protein TonB